MHLRILCVHIETSSLWAEFINKNRCISVRLVSEGVKSIKFWKFTENFINYLCERCQAPTSVLCQHYRLVTLHCSSKEAYTSEITFLALNPCGKVPSILIYRVLVNRNHANMHFMNRISRGGGGGELTAKFIEIQTT